MAMVQQNIDFIGGGFKLTLPYTFGGWFLWVIGLAITGFGVVAAMSDPVGLAVSVIGLIVMAAASPGSMSAGLHKMRKEAIAPEVLQAKAEQSGFTMDNWFLQQSTLIPTNDPNDWVLPAPGPQTWNTNMYGPHGDGTPLPEHPAKVGTPRPATMTSHFVFAGLAAILTVVVGGVIAADEEADVGVIPALAIAGIGLILLLVNYFRAKALRQCLTPPTSLVRSAPVGHPELVGQVRPWAAGTMTVYVDSNESHGHAPHGRLLLDLRTGASAGRSKTTKETRRPSAVGSPFARTAVACRSFFTTEPVASRSILNRSSEPNTAKFIKQWDGAFAQIARQAADGSSRLRACWGAPGSRSTAGPSTVFALATRSTCLEPPNRALLLNCKLKDWTVRSATAPSKSGATRTPPA